MLCRAREEPADLQQAHRSPMHPDVAPVGKGREMKHFWESTAESCGPTTAAEDDIAEEPEWLED